MPLLCDFSVIFYQLPFIPMWKLANVTPIYKEGDKLLIKNYRPISLLPICGKMFEKLYFQPLQPSYYTSPTQFGFRPGGLTANQLIDLVNGILHAFDRTKSLEVRVISQSLLIVWHDGLLFKMRQNGVSGRLLKLFQNYLNNRKQRMVLNGFPAISQLITLVAPKGPLLFR